MRSRERADSGSTRPSGGTSLGRAEQVQRPGGVAHDPAQAARVQGASGRFHQGVDRLGADVAGHADDVAELALQLRRRRQVVGDRGDHRRARLALLVLQHPAGDAGMADGARRLGERLVRRLAHGVAAELPAVATHLQQTELVELAHRRAGEALLQRGGELLQVGDRAGAAEHGRVLDHLTLQRGELVEARADEAAQRIGQFGGRAGPRQRSQLLEEQRVAAAALVEPVQQPIVRFTAGQQAAGQLVGLGVRQGLQREGDDAQPLAVRRPVEVAPGAHRRDEREGVAGQGVHEVVEQLDEAGVGPVQVVDREDRRLVLAHPLERLGHGPVDRRAGTGRIEVIDRRGVPVDVGEDVHDPLGLGGVEARRQRGGALRALDAQVVGGDVRVDVEVLGQRQGDRPVGAGLPVGDAVGMQQADLAGGARRQPVEDLGDQPALADAALADERQDHRPLTLDGLLQRALGDGQLGLPTDHRHLEAVAPADARGRGSGDGQPGGDRPLPAAGDQIAGRLVVDRVRGERVSDLADDHPARWRHRLQPRRGVDHVAHGRVLGAGQRADEHLAGVDPDAHADVDVAVGRRAGHRAVQRVLHPQAGAHGALRIVLVRHRRAEQGEDPVAEQLVDPAAVLGDVVHEAGEGPVDQPLGLLGVHVLGQGGEPDEVGEQHGDDPPLLVGQHAERVTARGAEPRSVRDRRGARRAGHQPASVRHIRLRADAESRADQYGHRPWWMRRRCRGGVRGVRRRPSAGCAATRRAPTRWSRSSWRSPWSGRSSATTANRAISDPA